MQPLHLIVAQFYFFPPIKKNDLALASHLIASSEM